MLAIGCQRVAASDFGVGGHGFPCILFRCALLLVIGAVLLGGVQLFLCIGQLVQNGLEGLAQGTHFIGGVRLFDQLAQLRRTGFLGCDDLLQIVFNHQ